RIHTKDHVPEGLKGIPSPDRMIASFHGDNLTPADLEKAIEAASKYETAELMCHPGYLDTFVMHNSSYNRERAKELDVLVSGEAREIIERYKVELISFKDL
ncbi:MAG: ChbG/HpnK family deacetylase, partial [Youngiibacter sp.]|nr:ChbG/HpnK family deacetylase [Youngiibacter sp.]